VCIYEVFKVVLRERGEDDAFSAATAMQQGTVIDLDADPAMEVAAVALEEGVAFADSVTYTVAKRQNATLWTPDAHFIGKSGVQYQAKRIRA
jgi:toxin FitB